MRARIYHDNVIGFPETTDCNTSVKCKLHYTICCMFCTRVRIWSCKGQTEMAHSELNRALWIITMWIERTSESVIWRINSVSRLCNSVKVHDFVNVARNSTWIPLHEFWLHFRCIFEEDPHLYSYVSYMCILN